MPAKALSRSIEGVEYNLYWGDFHKHITGPRRGRLAPSVDNIDPLLRTAREHLDIYVPLCYPFDHYKRGRAEGLSEETVGNRPQFLELWETVQRYSEEFHDPGEFVTFPGYEWNGDRSRWGDHNVIYFEEGYPLDDTRRLPELYENLRERKAFAIPHHTAYVPEHRAKDWDVWDRDLSPVMEIFSGQGSSEDVGTPVDMSNNTLMAPRTTGTTYRDALQRGHRIGVIASNDWMGLPGSWNSGVAGIWARELTREAIWEAIEERRTIGVTGDRMVVWLEIGETPLGGVLSTGDDTAGVKVSVDCPQPLDRIELVCDGEIWDTYTHESRERRVASEKQRYRVEVTLGWGPTRAMGDFDDVECRWDGDIQVQDGELLGVQPRLSGFPHRIECDDHRCSFSLGTATEDTPRFPPSRADVHHHKQGLVLDLRGSHDTQLIVNLDGEQITAETIDHLIEHTVVTPLLEESEERISSEFDVQPNELVNHDIYYVTARKVKYHLAHAVEKCRATWELSDVPVGNFNSCYARVSQVDGQYAWTSPVWFE
jgi:hypothetical protein